MRSHLNLEHKTFLGGKLPSCVSARSAAQGIQSDRCQYHSCSTDSNNENSTQLSLGFDSVTLSLLNLCPQQYVEFYRDNVFKCLCSSGVVGHLLFVLRGIRAVGALSSQGCLPATPRQHLGVHGGCLSFSFLFSSPANPLFLPLRSGPRRGGRVGSTGFFLSQHCSFVVT